MNTQNWHTKTTSSPTTMSLLYIKYGEPPSTNGLDIWIELNLRTKLSTRPASSITERDHEVLLIHNQYISWSAWDPVTRLTMGDWQQPINTSRGSEYNYSL